MSSVHPIGAERGLLNRAVVNVRARSGVALLRACAHRWALQSACDPDVRFILVTVNILTWFFDCSWLWLASWIGPSEKNQGDRKHVCLNSRCRTSSPSSPQSSPQTAWNSLTNSSKAGYSRPSCVCVCMCDTRVGRLLHTCTSWSDKRAHFDARKHAFTPTSDDTLPLIRRKA